MAEVTLRLRRNPQTGERELVIDYESEPDALGFEHEREHRGLAEDVVGEEALEAGGRVAPSDGAGQKRAREVEAREAEGQKG